jgi:protocatechuate 3,4-dioxygenase beta subunit
MAMTAKNSLLFPALLAALLVFPLTVQAGTLLSDCEAGPEILAVAGRVVDAVGRPIAGAVVWELPAANSLAVSNADGYFVTQTVDPGSTMEVCRDGYFAEELRRPLDTRTVEIVLHPVSSISGRVLASDGSPVPGVTVSAWDSRSVPSDLIGGLPARRLCPRSEPSGEASTETDVEGRFTLAPLAAGQYDVEATGAGYRTTSSGHFDLRPGAEIVGVEVWFEPGVVIPKRERVAEAEVYGRVITPQGDPVAGAEVSVANDTPRARTDAQGAYRLTPVSLGNQEIWAVTEEDGVFTRSLSKSIKVAPGENQQDSPFLHLGARCAAKCWRRTGGPWPGRGCTPGAPVPSAPLSGRKPASTARSSSTCRRGPAGSWRLWKATPPARPISRGKSRPWES